MRRDRPSPKFASQISTLPRRRIASRRRSSPLHLPTGRAVGIVLELNALRKKLVANAVGLLEIAFLPGSQARSDGIGNRYDVNGSFSFDALGYRREAEQRE